MVTRRHVAIIPARGGSKRIEKKNIIDFRGKPLLAWTIEAALRSAQFDRVVVSTDDGEIRSTALRYGASVPFLRKDFADDDAPVSLATLSTLQQLSEELGEQYDLVTQLMPNCPLRNDQHIIEAIDHFITRAAKSQISCFKYGWMNPWWAVTISPEGRPTSLFPEAFKARSQDLPTLYCPSGAVWIADVQHLYAHSTFHSPDRICWPMPWHAAVDIDDQDDLRMAELLFLTQEAHP